MIQPHQGFAWIVVIIATTGVFAQCAKGADSSEEPRTVQVGDDKTARIPGGADSQPVSPTSMPASATKEPEAPSPSKPESNHRIVDKPLAPGEYWIRLQFRPDKKLYFVIENDFKEHGGVPGLLTYTVTASDKRTIIQSSKSINQKPDAGQPQYVELLWECDRYEVRDKGMKDELTFDSIRDLYPTTSLRELGSIPGSKVTFSIDPHTGRTKGYRIVRGEMRGPTSTSRKQLSKVTKRCALNEPNLRMTLDDLGSLFIPGSPKRVGDSWTARRSRTVKSAGQVNTEYVFTLRDVRELDGREIARIDVGGNVQLESGMKIDEPNPTSQPKRRPSKKKHKFKITKAVCKGSIEFDLTHGELVRMLLRRELTLSAGTSAKEGKKPMTLETGNEHVFRVEVSRTPPPKPVIVGGPKPPKLEKGEKPLIKNDSKGRQRIDTKSTASKKKKPSKARSSAAQKRAEEARRARAMRNAAKRRSATSQPVKPLLERPKRPIGGPSKSTTSQPADEKEAD